MASIMLTGIAKHFGGTPALKNVSLEIRDGEFLALVGPSGCGKSTLLRIIAGLEEQDRGEVLLGDQRIDHLRPKARDVAMVFQSYALYPHMSVFANMAVPLRMRRLTQMQRWPLARRLSRRVRDIEAEIKQDVEGVAQALAISHLFTRKPAQLSGGQRQRVALGRAMVRHPKVFLMDEPLSNLDASLRVQMRTELADLHRRLGTTFVYVTHDQAEAMTMADRIAVVKDGELLQVAPPHEVYGMPANIDVAKFIGTPQINLFPATLRSDGSVDSGPLHIPLVCNGTTGEALTVGVRPEALKLDRRASGGWRGMINHVEHLGADLFVHVKIVDPEMTAIIRLDPHAEGVPSIGSYVGVAPLPERTSIFDQNGLLVPGKARTDSIEAASRKEAAYV